MFFPKFDVFLHTLNANNCIYKQGSILKCLPDTSKLLTVLLPTKVDVLRM